VVIKLSFRGAYSYYGSKWGLRQLQISGDLPPTPSPTMTPTTQTPTTNLNSRLGECIGSDPPNCGCGNVKQEDYRGTISTTKNGHTCQRCLTLEHPKTIQTKVWKKTTAVIPMAKTELGVTPSMEVVGSIVMFLFVGNN